MRDFGWLLLLALIPAGGSIIGALIAEFATVGRKARSLALHAAAGIVLAVVAVELLPEALEARPRWVIIVAFACGGLVFVGIDRAVELISSLTSEREQRGAWMIFVAVALDLFTDGVMVGTGGTVRFSLAMLLALAQIPGNIPEGFATIATLKSAGVVRKRRLIALAALVVAAMAGASAGYFLLRGQPLVYRMGTLAFTAGILTTMVVEEIVPESHERAEARTAVLFFIGGFVLFMAIASYVD